MKLLKFMLRRPLAMAGMLLLASCAGNDSDKTLVKQGDSLIKSPKGQFTFYRNINIRPGINFEVVSWGKGVDSVGGYLILMSDSLKNNYKSLSDEREGVITDAFNLDLDTDGNPEIYIELLSKKNVRDLQVYEYSGGSFNKITFPGLSSSLKKNYDGNDKYMIKDGELFRTFPLVNPKDSTQKAGTIKIVHYSLRSNSFSSSEVKEESAEKKGK